MDYAEVLEAAFTMQLSGHCLVVGFDLCLHLRGGKAQGLLGWRRGGRRDSYADDIEQGFLAEHKDSG